MGIDTLETGKVHIQDLGLDQPKNESEILFDVEKEVSESDFQNIEMEFNRLNELASDFQFPFNQLIFTRILAPERFGHLKINPVQQEKLLQEYQKEVQDKSIIGSGFRTLYMCNHGKMLKLVAPGVYSKIKLTNKDFNELKWGFNSNFRIRPEQGISYAFNLLILFPKKQKEIGRLIENQWGYIEEMIDTNLKNGDVECVAYCKILCPELFKEIRIKNEDIQKTKTELNNYRYKAHWISFVKQAACLKILSADRVNITAKGIEAIMPKKEENLKTPKAQPVERSY